jgi:hypothetical protein
MTIPAPADRVYFVQVFGSANRFVFAQGHNRADNRRFDAGARRVHACAAGYYSMNRQI